MGWNFASLLLRKTIGPFVPLDVLGYFIQLMSLLFMLDTLYWLLYQFTISCFAVWMGTHKTWLAWAAEIDKIGSDADLEPVSKEFYLMCFGWPNKPNPISIVFWMTQQAQSHLYSYFRKRIQSTSQAKPSNWPTKFKVS